MKEIRITIDEETGQTAYESHGYPGATCSVPAEAAKELLGRPTQERPTAEMRATTRSRPTIRQGGAGG